MECDFPFLTYLMNHGAYSACSFHGTQLKDYFNLMFYLSELEEDQHGSCHFTHVSVPIFKNSLQVS
jgi:hypothetical protein